MSDTLIHPSPHQGLFSNLRLTRVLAWVLPVLVLLTGFIYWILPILRNPSAPENAPVPQSAAIEEKYGIRISMLAVTADSGMVDFRYIVLDPVKAQTFGTTPDTTPVLYPAVGKTFVAVTAPMPHKDVIHAGITYFLLYQNAAASIKPRTYVTVTLGDIQLERVPVR